MTRGSLDLRRTLPLRGAGAPRYFGNSVANELSSSMPLGLSSFLKGSTFQWSMPSWSQGLGLSCCTHSSGGSSGGGEGWIRSLLLVLLVRRRAAAAAAGALHAACRAGNHSTTSGHACKALEARTLPFFRGGRSPSFTGPSSPAGGDSSPDITTAEYE